MSPGAAVIKHYQIVSCLGQGGFGKVFEAWDSKLQRSVAIKCLNADGLLSPATDLLREARMAASLNHPAFVKIHALEDDDNSQAIVMELIKGETLKQVIVNRVGVNQSRTTQSNKNQFEENQSRENQAINIIRQIAEAMQQAHDLGLTHGDLKPSNIMLEPSGAIRILDFGLASKADTQATTSMLQQDPQGTIAYMAPERLLGAPLAPPIDIYALGVIFYELLNSQRPFAELNGLALAAALVQSSSDQWNYSQELSPQLIHIIRCMTAKQAAQRLSSMADVLAQLDTFGNGVLPENKLPPLEIVIAPELKREPPKSLRNQHLKNAVLFSLVVIGCVVFGGWITRNYLWRFEDVIPRYSESQEMKLGMDALEQWDRPGSLDAAIKHFNNLAEQNPENAAAIAGLSIAYSFRFRGDKVDDLWFKKATASAQQAYKLNPHLIFSHIALAGVLLEQGAYDLAAEHYDAAFKLDPLNQFVWYGKIETLRALKQYSQAVAVAKAGSEKFPQQRTFHDLIGLSYMSEGKYAEAEASFRNSIRLQPDSIYAYANLSSVLHYQGRSEEAIHVLQQGLQIRPSAWLYANLGNVYFFSGRYTDAASVFDAALNPALGGADDYLNWANLADTLLWIPGRKAEAGVKYKKARELIIRLYERHPENIQLASRLALYNARLNFKAESQRLLAKLTGVESASPEFHFRVALAYELIGERQSALRELRLARQLGYPLDLIAAEPDLESLRRDAGYDIY